MTTHRHDCTRPADLSAALRKMADEIDSGKKEGQTNLGIVVHMLPVPHPECPGMIGDMAYTGETAVISSRPMPADLRAAVERFFNDSRIFYYPPMDAAAKQKAEAAARQSNDRISLPRIQHPLDLCGIRKEEMTPNSVIVITYPVNDQRVMIDKLNECAVQISAMVDRPVILQPTLFEASSMPLAEVVKLRDRLNEIIYDKERAKT